MDSRSRKRARYTLKGGNMSIFDKELFKNRNKIEKAIEFLKEFEPPEGYYTTFSGGKDSITIEHLCKLAEVKYDLHHSYTTVDPPEVFKFIKENYPNCEIHKPEKSMFQWILHKKMPPTRMVRYCCDKLKEGGGEGRVIVTGVRWAESTKRKTNRKEVELFDKSTSKKTLELKEIILNGDNDTRRKTVEMCMQKRKWVVNPIISWTDAEVWEFIKYYKLPYPKLYDQGFKRIGCIGCPLSSNGREELEKFPKFKNAYINCFEKMIKIRNEEGFKTDWKTGEEVLEWYLPTKKNKK